MWELDHIEAEHWRIDAFELWWWRRLLRVPWTSMRSNQSILKEYWIFIGRTDAEIETPVLWPLDAKNWLIGKDPDSGKDWKQEEKRTAEDEMVGWHRWLDGHGFEQAPRVGDRQGSLTCCSMGSQRVGHDWVTELNWWPILLNKGPQSLFMFSQVAILHTHSLLSFFFFNLVNS